VNVATSKKKIAKSTTFPNLSIHKYAFSSPDGEKHNEIDHILIAKRRYSNVVNFRSFRGVVYDTGYYLAVAEVKESLSVSSRAAQKFHMEEN